MPSSRHDIRAGNRFCSIRRGMHATGDAYEIECRNLGFTHYHPCFRLTALSGSRRPGRLDPSGSNFSAYRRNLRTTAWTRWILTLSWRRFHTGGWGRIARLDGPCSTGDLQYRRPFTLCKTLRHAISHTASTLASSLLVSDPYP